jgi:site-specific DNA-cytosine methylase
MRIVDGIREYTVYCPFGGGGGGALGVISKLQTMFGKKARFRLIGGFDFDPYACAAFEYLTGVKELCIDAWAMTVEDLRRDAGEEAPDFIFSSAPCVASSQLVSPAKAATAPYVKINSLIEHVTNLILKAWPLRPPKALLFENVPNIANRARAVLAGVVDSLLAAKYVIHQGRHQCRTTGNLAQNRLRWFMVARHAPQMPHFLYRPEKQPGRVCRDVLSCLPRPGAHEGGPMHVEPNIAVVNAARLGCVPVRGTVLPDGRLSKGDWRDIETVLKSHVDALNAFRMHRVKAAQNSVFKVAGWNQPTGAVTSAESPANGCVSAADPRPFLAIKKRFKGSMGVLADDEVADTVTAEAYPSTGRNSYADAEAVRALALGCAPWAGAYGVTSPAEAIAAVTAAACIDNGPYAMADEHAAPTLAKGAKGSKGRKKVARKAAAQELLGFGATVERAAARKVEPAKRVERVPGFDSHATKYVMVGYGSKRGAGAEQMIAEVCIDAFRGAWGVVSQDEASATVIGNARPSTGPFAIADAEALLVSTANDCCYGVLKPTEPSHAVTGKSHPGNGPFSMADPADIDEARGVVLSIHQVIAAITEYGGDGSFVVFDSTKPGSAPLLWVEGLDKPARAWAGFEKKGKKKGQVKRGAKVQFVIIAEDGTRHRPLTTLELAVLQGLPWMHNGKALDFGGGSTAQRKLVGNMVPPPVAASMAGQILLALMAAEDGSFYLDAGGSGVWVQREEHLARLAREGVMILDESIELWDMGSAFVCDDGAVIPKQDTVLPEGFVSLRHAPIYVHHESAVC